jgi:hypothetical protein
MFAVIILGIGFIMIAAIFPVAIQQSQTTNEESAAASIAREAASTITALPQTIPNPYIPGGSLPTYPQTLKVFPPTVKNYTPGNATAPLTPPAVVVPFVGPRWDAIKNNVILSSDSRYAYVPFYRRENGSASAQLIVVAVEVRNRTNYDSSKDLTYANGTLLPTTVTRAAAVVSPALTTINPDSIVVTGGAEGDCITFPPATVGVAGRTYRLGRQLTSGFELEPADGLVLGAGPDGLWGTTDDFTDPAGGPQGYLFYPATLQPLVVYADIYSAPGSVAGRITLSTDIAHAVGATTYNTAPADSTNVPPVNVATGAFVIVADDYPYDPTATGTAGYTVPTNAGVGSHNGRIYRLGQPVPANASATPPVPPGTYDLDPAYGMQAGSDAIPIQANGPWARVFIVGVGRTDPQNNATGYSGTAQDIAVYTTFFPVQ